jgi:hypothetical protein
MTKIREILATGGLSLLATPKQPKVEKLREERLQRLGSSTLDFPIPEEHKRVHAAVIARAWREQRAK